MERWPESGLDSIGSSGPSDALKTGARAAVEGAVVAALGTAVAVQVFAAPAVVFGVEAGAAAAWAASAVSAVWLMWARGRGMRSFWWAFGGGMALRAGVLATLALWGFRRVAVSLDALLISYVFALLALLLSFDFRYLRVR